MFLDLDLGMTRYNLIKQICAIIFCKLGHNFTVSIAKYPSHDNII